MIKKTNTSGMNKTDKTREIESKKRYKNKTSTFLHT